MPRIYFTHETILQQDGRTDRICRHAFFILLLIALIQSSAAGLATEGTGKIAWVKLLGERTASFQDQGKALAIDSDGNIYVGGGVILFSSSPNQPVLTKISPTGDVVWELNASSQDSSSGVNVIGLAISGGDLFLIAAGYGRFSIGDFTPQPGNSALIIGRIGLDKTPKWFKQINGYSLRDGRLAGAPDGGVYIGCPYGEEVSYENISLSRTGSGNANIALFRLDSSGHPLWARRGIGDSECSLDNLKEAPNGDVVIGVTFSSATYDSSAFGIAGVFAPGARPDTYSKAEFVGRIDQNGSGKWARSLFSIAATNRLNYVSGICAASNGDVLWAADFVGTTLIGNQEISSKGAGDVAVARMGQDGQPKWVRTLGGSGYQSGADCAVDSRGNTFVAGFFEGTIEIGSDVLSCYGERDIFLAKLSLNGTPLWAKQIGYVGYEWDVHLAVTIRDEIIVVGSVEGGGIFDDVFIESAVGVDAFVLKILPDDQSAPLIETQPSSLTLNPMSEARFSVTASDSNGVLKYQWFFNDKPIPGATSSDYRIPSVTAANEGYYSVDVTNDSGTVRSTTARLVIKGPVPVLVTTVAGTNVAGYVDSNIGSNARFYQPNGLAYFSGGLIAVADGLNHLIRLVDAGTGATDTYAGQNTPGYLDGPSKSAKFHSPLGLTVDKSLDVLVADYSNNLIRRIDSFGLRNVSTVAGTGVAGYKDGTAAEVQFNSPNDLVVDANGNIFVTEFTNHTVRKITPGGEVSTFAGNGTAGYQDGSGTSAQFNQPGGLTIDPVGNLYVTEWTGGRVRKITPQGLVTTIAGTNKTGFVDGQGSAAMFWLPDGITIDPVGNLYVTEAGNMAIRKIDPQGNVTTIAGLGVPGFQDGDKATALFNVPGGIMWHPSGSLFVSDTGNNSIRRIDFLKGQTNSESAELLISLNPTLTIFGKAGATYRIEGAEAGSGPLDWTTLDTITIINNAEMWADPQPATRQKRYYRAVKVN